VAEALREARSREPLLRRRAISKALAKVAATQP
jgi:hypothetical protein